LAEDHEDNDLFSKCCFAQELACQLSPECELDKGKAERELSRLFERVKNCCTTKREEADIFISNTHQQKGLEYDVVILSDDFCTLRSTETGEIMKSDRIKDSLCLVYVAMTRAKNTLVLNEELDFLWFTSLRPSVFVLRLRRAEPTTCCMCDCQMIPQKSSESSTDPLMATLERSGFHVVFSRERHALGNTFGDSKTLDIKAAKSRCCLNCLAHEIQERSLQQEDSFAYFLRFWGSCLFPPSLQTP